MKLCVGLAIPLTVAVVYSSSLPANATTRSPRALTLVSNCPCPDNACNADPTQCNCTVVLTDNACLKTYVFLQDPATCTCTTVLCQ
jgi:hypothetical protein